MTIDDYIIGLWWLMLTIKFTESRIIWKLGLWAYLCNVYLVLINVVRPAHCRWRPSLVHLEEES